MKIVQILLFALCFISALALQGQGWKRTFIDRTNSSVAAIELAEDGGYFLVGQSSSFGDDNDDDIYVVRLDLNGKELWSNFFDESLSERAFDAMLTEDGGLLIAGTIQTSPIEDTDAYLLKVNAFGELEWSKSFGGAGEDSFAAIEKTNDGYILAGRTNSFDLTATNAYAVKVSSAGEVIWETNIGSELEERASSVAVIDDRYYFVGLRVNPITSFRREDVYAFALSADSGVLTWENTYGGGGFQNGKSIAVAPDGNLLIGGNANGSTQDFYLLKIDAEGEQVWEQTYETVVEEEFAKLKIQVDGAILLAGNKGSENGLSADLLLVKLDEDGNVIWEREYGDAESFEQGADLVFTPDEGYALVGNSIPDLFAGTLADFVIVKTDLAGNIYSNRIQGQVYYDRNSNNTFDEGDLPLKDWPVEMDNRSGGAEPEKFLTVSDENGFYEIIVNVGTYSIDLLNQNDNYWSIGNNSLIRTFTTTYDTLGIDFPVQAEILCPYVEVNVSAPSLNDCSEIVYTVSLCNDGSTNTENFSVDVTFDELLSINSASLPIQAQEGNQLTFDISDLDIGACTDFTVNTTMACEGYVVGQSLKTTAKISEELACFFQDPDWDQSSLVVSGECAEEGEESEVAFKVTNKGESMIAARNIGVMEEDVVVFMAPINLAGGRDTTIFRREARGRTHRIVAEQSEGHPGRSFPTVAVEGCGTDEDGNITTGFVTQFPEDDADPFIDIDVQESLAEDVIGSFMRAYPKGYRAERFIETGKDITYHIQFQNLGDTPLRHIVIRDTLPAALDISNIELAGSSHPFDFEIYEERILRFTFDKISIPTAAENEAASKGFLKFRVKQMPDLTPGTVIENNVLVAFNLQKPFLLNGVKHTIGGAFEDFVEVSLLSSTNEKETTGVSVTAQPNPFIDNTLLKINGWTGKQATFKLFDVQGRFLHQASFQDNQLRYNNANLSAGIYFFRVEVGGQILDTGKLVIE